MKRRSKAVLLIVLGGLAGIALAFLPLFDVRHDVGSGDAQTVASGNTHRSISLSINEVEVTVGNSVQLRALISEADMPSVWGTDYSVEMIGFFHRKLNRLVYQDIFFDYNLFFGDDLPCMSMFSHASGPSATDGHDCGFETDFAARRVGIYRLSTSWKVSEGDSDEVIRSNSVTLIVSPKFDPVGNAIINADNVGDLKEHALLEKNYDKAQAAWKTPLKQVVLKISEPQ